MTPPQVKHNGFLIPNAGDVNNPKMAEPDRIDFNTVGNDRWGVIEGCLVVVSGATASTLGGTAVVNGELVTVKNGSVGLGSGASQDRFDLLVTDQSGTLKVIPGTASADPVFPDPELTETVLAAVFCPSGSSNFENNVIDKRNWLADALLTKVDSTKPLIQNRNGTGNAYWVGGDGKTVWDSDTQLLRSSAETLRVVRHLDIDGHLAVGDDVTTGGAVVAEEEVTGSNLVRSATTPPAGNPGDLWQHSTTGRVYVWQNGEWEELATISGAVPVGAVIQSMVGPDVMGPLGWVPLNGDTIEENDYPNLFTISALVSAGVVTGTAPNRTLQMPNASQKILITDFATPGRTGGSSTVTLTAANLPAHNHGISIGEGGSHGHSIAIQPDGDHTHTTGGGGHVHQVGDPGHAHNGGDFFGYPSAFIVPVWGGGNKLDALFNDRSHTYSVEPVSWTMRAQTGIAVSEGGSGHGHFMNGSGPHTHIPTLGTSTGHDHPLTVHSVGEGTAVPIDPPYLTVFTYIRS